MYANQTPTNPTPHRSAAPLVVVLVAGLGLVALLAAAGGFLLMRSSASTHAAPVAAPSKANTDDLAGAITVAGTLGASGADAAGTAAAGSGAVVAPAPKPAPGPTPAPAPQPAAPKPVITTFTTPENIDCHNNDHPNFSANWTTTNATKTTISMDGALVQSYGPSASVSLPFNCSSAHTYTLTAIGQNGSTTTKAITLQPRNVRPPADADDMTD